ncbi:class I SAM-dependent methyltransferase family protein [Candidatus Woesearchaeota archaeon]|nr:class I SAM-dependent methyltransferase family protein [Candidatus Woesearchaeota archaeon]
MLTLKVPLKEAEKTKKSLIVKDLLDHFFIASKDKSHIFFPVKKRFSSGFEFVERSLKPKEERKSLKEALGSKLSKQEMEVLNTSMDVTGQIAILEIPDELGSRIKIIAREALKANPQLKTVLKKGKHEGVFRTQKLAWLAGEKTKEAVYKENGVTLRFDVEKVYFSPRLSNDRKRVAGLVKKDEDVLVMFSGCGPYTCVIAKNSAAKRVVGVEINPEGHKYALENIKANKLRNAEAVLGDAKKTVLGLSTKFDRILMPLPASSQEFLQTALAAAKKGATIHFYQFQDEDKTEESVKMLREACKEAGLKFKLLRIIKCGQNSPRSYRFCFDFRVD